VEHDKAEIAQLQSPSCWHTFGLSNSILRFTNPTLIIEVLSKSTEGYDRGDKFGHYRKVESLSEYILISQDKHHIEHYVRQPDNQWLLSEADDLQVTIELPAINCRLALADIYDKVELES
jgi:Uma2 family endonuclease